MKNIWKKFWDKYMTGATEKIDRFEFSSDETKRYQIVFSGIVQGVGFRYETWSLAQKLGLTGFVENLPNGNVYAEIQGPGNKVSYLIEMLKTIPRIHIEKIEMDEIAIKDEVTFEIAN